MNSLNDISCTYILNLDSEKYKYDILKKKLDSFNLDLKIKRFPAIDGNLYKEEFHKLHEIYYNNLSRIKKKYYFQQNNIKNIKTDFNKIGLYRSYGAYGCLLSYIKIFEDAIKNNYENIFLLQDDIYFHKDFVNLANQEIKNNKDDILCFAYTGLFSTIINKNVFEKILNKLKLKIYPADITIEMYFKRKFSKKEIIIADVTKSNTQTDKNFYKNYYIEKKINLNDFDLTEKYYN